MPSRPSLWRLFAGSASPSVADLRRSLRKAREDRWPESKAKAQELVARRDTRPFASIEVLPADQRTNGTSSRDAA